MDIDVFPNSLEYWGPNGMVFFRNVQVRWIPIQGDSNVVIALERPGATADQGLYSDRIELQAVRPQFKWPDVTGHARWHESGVMYSGRHIQEDCMGGHKRSVCINLSGTAYGWGVNVSSNLNFTKKDVGRFRLSMARV